MEPSRKSHVIELSLFLWHNVWHLYPSSRPRPNTATLSQTHLSLARDILHSRLSYETRLGERNCEGRHRHNHEINISEAEISEAESDKYETFISDIINILEAELLSFETEFKIKSVEKDVLIESRRRTWSETNWNIHNFKVSRATVFEHFVLIFNIQNSKCIQNATEKSTKFFYSKQLLKLHRWQILNRAWHNKDGGSAFCMESNMA